MPDRILLSHGSGGRMAHELIQSFLKTLGNPVLDRLDDSAVIELNGKVAFTTDSHVVSPIFFPGGDIGRLSVCGTVNDLSMSGARPVYLSLSFIIEEGLTINELERVIVSIQGSAEEAGVKIINADTKVVSQGSADKLFINTAGIGTIPNDVNISGSNARPGDKVILSGNIGDHSIAVLSKREGLTFTTSLQSDCAPLGHMVSQMISVSTGIRALRDPTRGGLASTLNEIAT